MSESLNPEINPAAHMLVQSFDGGAVVYSVGSSKRMYVGPFEIRHGQAAVMGKTVVPFNDLEYFRPGKDIPEDCITEIKKHFKVTSVDDQRGTIKPTE